MGLIRGVLWLDNEAIVADLCNPATVTSQELPLYRN